MPRQWSNTWPVLRRYDRDHIGKIAMPLGGIGTGTVSLGGRGDLRDWEVMNRPAKGYTPTAMRECGPSFVLRTSDAAGKTTVRLLEGPLDLHSYEGAEGCRVINHGMPRMGECEFAAAYPLAQIALSDAELPVRVRLEAFNPLVPADPEDSGIPAAMLRFVLQNPGDTPITASICGSIPNFIGADGTNGRPAKNRNEFREAHGATGLLMRSGGVPRESEQWGTMALATTARDGATRRTAWKGRSRWGSALLDFWDDFSDDGNLDDRDVGDADSPMASVCVRTELPANSESSVLFLIAWHFPNRTTWTPCKDSECCSSDTIGNYYTTSFDDAWDVVAKVAPRLEELERRTVEFVGAFCESDLPAEVKEAALFNLSSLRSQTCFRTPDGHFYGWEGCGDRSGCCHGSCTHVWNYEQATAFLFGSLARSMRTIEFEHATRENGFMNFRVDLPLSRARESGGAAADGQMGCIMKLYRDWQLSGDDAMLRRLWPKARKALEFCWIDGGWDADRDGVMEGCQHNTMDVEYYGPNPQMGTWYLGALRAGEEMANSLGETAFASDCRRLFENGKAWIDEHLFNGEYYEHKIVPPESSDAIADGLRLHMGAEDLSNPDYQLGPGCLVDQLAGQFMAHICGLGYLLDEENVKKTLQSIGKYNLRRNLGSHFNCLRSFALGDESALLMASYPKGRPDNPFPYFTEVMTGFEYTAAVGMIQEGLVDEGLECIRNVRERYDGRKRSPFDEAECGHHYARAMASWAAVTALTGFQYSAVSRHMQFAAAADAATAFWSTGDSWGTIEQRRSGSEISARLTVLGGILRLERITLAPAGSANIDGSRVLETGQAIEFSVAQGEGHS